MNDYEERLSDIQTALNELKTLIDEIAFHEHLTDSDKEELFVAETYLSDLVKSLEKILPLTEIEKIEADIAEIEADIVESQF